MTSGKYAPLDNLEFKYKKPVLTEDEVISIAKNDDSVVNVLNKYPCLSIQMAHFQDSRGIWTVPILIRDAEIEIGYDLEIDEKGAIFRNTILLTQQVKALGYDFTVEDTLREYIDEYGCD